MSITVNSAIKQDYTAVATAGNLPAQTPGMQLPKAIAKAAVDFLKANPNATNDDFRNSITAAVLPSEKDSSAFTQALAKAFPDSGSSPLWQSFDPTHTFRDIAEDVNQGFTTKLGLDVSAAAVQYAQQNPGATVGDFANAVLSEEHGNLFTDDGFTDQITQQLGGDPSAPLGQAANSAAAVKNAAVEMNPASILDHTPNLLSTDEEEAAQGSSLTQITP